MTWLPIGPDFIDARGEPPLAYPDMDLKTPAYRTMKRNDAAESSIAECDLHSKVDTGRLFSCDPHGGFVSKNTCGSPSHPHHIQVVSQISAGL